MHSRIFQLSKKPIGREDYITEMNYWNHWFLHSVADYVTDDCDRNEDIEWLQNATNGISFGKDEYGEYLVIESKAEYFEQAFTRFKELLNDIKYCTIEDFAKGIQEVYIMKNIHEEKWGFYVEINDELMPFDNFIRAYNVQDKFYIGGTVDYHY